jgi:FAD/FMN-containing dehydrogenase
MTSVVTNATKPTAIDTQALAAELRTQIRGEVRFDEGSRTLYATDASNYRKVPIGVVIPRDVDDVIKIVAEACRYGAPLLARGGGTSLAGQCCNVAVVIDMSKAKTQFGRRYFHLHSVRISKSWVDSRFNAEDLARKPFLLIRWFILSADEIVPFHQRATS